MAAEIQIAYGTTGRTLYAVVRTTTGTVWNGATFEAFNAANWATYDIALTEQGTSGYYVGNFPVVAAGAYNVEARDQAGGSPVITDPVAGGGDLYWDGTAVQTLANVALSASSITAVVAAVWAFVITGAFTAVQIMRGIASFVMGKASGGNTAAPIFRDLDDTKNVLAMTVDSSGNRTAVNRDLT